jgi:DNA replication regulator SLD3
MVLIASSEDKKSFFAVEREERNLYAACKLGSWVKISQLCAEAVVSRNYSTTGEDNGLGRVSCVHQLVGESATTLESSKYSKKKRLAIEAIQSMVKRPSKDISTMSSELPAAQPHPDTVLETNSQEQPESQTQIDPKNRQEDIVPQPSAAEILDNIRLQYFEALYLSKVSEHFANTPQLLSVHLGIPCIFCKRPLIASSCSLPFRL